jgi:hypothetical protein
MRWRKTQDDWKIRQTGEAPAELLVAILTDCGPSARALADTASAWTNLFPRSDFVVFDRHDNLGVRISNALAMARLPPDRLLLVGAGRGARLALSFGLNATPPCAGVLAYDALPEVPAAVPPANRRVKIRIVGHVFDDPGRDHRLGDAVRALGDLGIDARATQLIDCGLTPAAIRLGTAYLAELSATALQYSAGGVLSRAAS